MAAKTQKVPVDHSALSGAPPKAQEPVHEDKAQEVVNHFTQGPQRLSERPVTPAGGLLSTITKGRVNSPPRIMLVGTEGIGKSTWAAAAPKPIFIQTEDGLGTINCEKFPLAKSFPEVMRQLTAIATEDHEYQTVVVDSVDWLERMIWDQVCARAGKKSIEEIGYAKGYIFAQDDWRELVAVLEKCHQRGMAVILVSHAKIEKFEDPENPAFDRFSPRLHKHAQALLTEWVDGVLFATRKLSIKRDGKKEDDRAIGIPVGPDGGERILRTTGSPTCLAKNRWGLPAVLPLSWEAFQTEIEKFMGSV